MNGENAILDSRETAPAASTAEMFIGDPMGSQVGPLAIAVPAEVKGLWVN
jgi:gamma-glutamyltranspeptidase